MFYAFVSPKILATMDHCICIPFFLQNSKIYISLAISFFKMMQRNLAQVEMIVNFSFFLSVSMSVSRLIKKHFTIQMTTVFYFIKSLSPM